MTDHDSPPSSSSPTTLPTTSAQPPQDRGTAGRTNYSDWDRKAQSLLRTVEQEAEEEEAAGRRALGLDGKYARSQAEAEERDKQRNVTKVKRTLDKYRKREAESVQEFQGLLGPVIVEDKGNAAVEETKATEARTVRIVRDHLEAGKRVVSITDTSGHSHRDTIVLTQDLSNLESKMMVNANAKSFPGSDAENAVVEEPATRERRIFGIIKCFVSNVHNCTILVKCKIISGTLEMHNCSNVHVQIDHEGTVATLQVDLSENLTIDFRDAPSGKNAGTPGQHRMVRQGVQ